VSGSCFISLELVRRPRLLGYAGAPIVFFTPCFILSILTAVRILQMRVRARQLRSQDGHQTQLTGDGNYDPRMPISARPLTSPMSGVSGKLSPQTLDGQTGMRIDVQLGRSLTQFSSRISLPLTPGTIESMSSNTHLPLELPAFPPLIIPPVHPSQPSPTPSNNSAHFLAIDRGRTPSPIMFASASVRPPNRNQGQPDVTGDSSNSCCTSSAHDRGISNSIHSDEQPKSPGSPSRAPIPFEPGDKTPRFHLPTRSPPVSLRPSLELSPEYVRARFEEDRVSGNPTASPSSLHRYPLSTLATRSATDIIGSLPSITYAEHALERLPEVDEAERTSVTKAENKVVSERKIAVSENQDAEPRLKPVRQFYREWLFMSVALR
jgi:hypothetical protein